MFNFDDTLVFFAIGYDCYHCGIASLAGILLAIDGMSKSTPTREELEASLNSLSASGYVAISGEGYLLTPAGKAVYDGVTAVDLPEKTVFDQIHEAQKKLAETHSLVENVSAIEITEKQYRKARKDTRILIKNL
ncbi:MAG: hypothetical protein LBE21_00580 [Pseudomonadales bacterium]|jgi:hypothetical protein|nr:hypothetical protein [Pseudomonadales bacterium]